MDSLLPLYSCCFTGHRQIPAAHHVMLEARTARIVAQLAAKGVRRFYTGGARGFDTLAAKTVLAVRRGNPEVKLILTLPCRDQTRGWCAADLAAYEEIKQAADEVICLSEEYTDICMQQRNRYLVEHSDCCVCYMTRSFGGTAYTVRYAEKRGLIIKNLAE